MTAKSQGAKKRSPFTSFIIFLSVGRNFTGSRQVASCRLVMTDSFLNQLGAKEGGLKRSTWKGERASRRERRRKKGKKTGTPTRTFMDVTTRKQAAKQRN